MPPASPPVATRREIELTRVAIGVTLIASLLAVSVIATRVVSYAAAVTPVRLVAGLLFLLIVTFLVYGSLVYQLTRLAYLKRLRLHRRASDDELLRLYRIPRAPHVTVLVPAYKEEAHVVRKTLLSAALQRYPSRRIVLLVDDPPHPANGHDLASLSAMRRLPDEVRELLRAPRQTCLAAFDAFWRRQANSPLDLRRERRALARLYRDTGRWFRAQAAAHPVADHVDDL